MKTFERRPLSHYWAPKYWMTWAGLSFLWVTCQLPYRWQMGVGRLIGRLAHRLSAERRAITRRNIALCFPDLSTSERDQLALRHFESLGSALMEMGLGRWASDEKLCSMTTITGAEHIQKTLDDGFGVILLSAHFTTLELSGRVLALNCPPFDAVYRRFRSDFTTEIMASGREVSARRVIEKNDIKSMVRSLREGTPVWYAPDQSYHLKQSALLPFFGVPAMTNTATGALAKLDELVVLPPIEDLPSGDAIEDTKKYVAVLEQHILRCPEQYFWVHRKFKNRPDSIPDAYGDLDSLK
jgi:KDO2-lipid IV(A) lauroyltransferase